MSCSPSCDKESDLINCIFRLGLQESVELLAGVAELDAGQIAPVCLEIAQLCGRVSFVSIHVVHLQNY